MECKNCFPPRSTVGGPDSSYARSGRSYEATKDIWSIVRRSDGNDCPYQWSAEFRLRATIAACTKGSEARASCGDEMDAGGVVGATHCAGRPTAVLRVEGTGAVPRRLCRPTGGRNRLLWQPSQGALSHYRRLAARAYHVQHTACMQGNSAHAARSGLHSHRRPAVPYSRSRTRPA
jgi:hypothetical protein